MAYFLLKAKIILEAKARQYIIQSIFNIHSKTKDYIHILSPSKINISLLC